MPANMDCYFYLVQNVRKSGISFEMVSNSKPAAFDIILQLHHVLNM